MLNRHLIPALILATIVRQQYRNCNENSGINSYNCDLCGYKLRRILVAECEWSKYIAQTEGHQEDSIHGNFLGVPLYTH